MRNLSLRSRLLSLLTLAGVSFLGAGVHAQSLPDSLLQRTYDDSAGFSLPYRLFVPENYDPARKYPLVLFLHGSGERGTDNTAPLEIEQFAQTFFSPEVQQAYPSFFLVPQCPFDVAGGDRRGEYWVNNYETDPEGAPHPGWTPTSYSVADYPTSRSLAAVTDLLPSLLSTFSIDSTRLYATGWSMGGDGTWDLLQRNPGVFAAGVPVAGVGDPTQAALLARTPLWVFQGAEDTAADPAGARAMVSAIEAEGGHIRYTEYADGGHYIVAEEGRVYQEAGFMDWLFSQQLPPTPTAAEPPSSVPEPGTLGLLLLGMAFAPLRRRPAS